MILYNTKHTVNMYHLFTNFFSHDPEAQLKAQLKIAEGQLSELVSDFNMLDLNKAKEHLTKIRQSVGNLTPWWKTFDPDPDDRRDLKREKAFFVFEWLELNEVTELGEFLDRQKRVKLAQDLTDLDWYPERLAFFTKPIVKAVVEKTGYKLMNASDELKNDQDVVLAAVKQDWKCLAFASDELKNNVVFMKKVVEINARALKYASVEIKENHEFV